MPVTLSAAQVARLRHVLETADVYDDACLALDAAHRARKSPAGPESAEQKRYRAALDVMLDSRRAVADGARELAAHADVRVLLGLPPRKQRPVPQPTQRKQTKKKANTPKGRVH